MLGAAGWGLPRRRPAGGRGLAGAGVPVLAEQHAERLGRSTIWNQTSLDCCALAGIEVLSYSIGPQLGQVRAGAMAGWTGACPAIWTGGFRACVAAACSTCAAQAAQRRRPN
ncbi:hypothetical protein LV779_15630 [Streptomyces thinghirensis]|nr:hypothetical protein [Streptomyces thinghirensis]